MSYLATTFFYLQALALQNIGTRCGEMYYHAMCLAAANLIKEGL
jgi:hypothetical protein